MHLTYQYRLMPPRAQHRSLERILEMQRLLYNAALSERQDAWRLKEISITNFDQTKSSTAVRKADPEGYSGLPVALSRWTLKRLDLAYAASFDRLKAKNGRAGFPRFRGMNGWRSFGFSEFCGIRLIGSKLLFKGMPGRLKVHFHRPLPADAPVRSCVFTKDDKGRSVAFQVEMAAANALVNQRLPVGLDVGVEHLATLSIGEHIASPRFGAAAAPAIRRAARKLSRARRGSKRREKTKRQLLRLRRKLANRRKTYLHQVSASLTRRFGAIAVEDLSIANMTRSAKGTVDRPGPKVKQKSGLNREVLDTSPATLIAMIAYKAERAGGRFVKIDARGTSQTCAECGAQVPKDLSLRIHNCPHCKTEVHRDVNSARNILKRAVAGPWSGDAEEERQDERREPTRLPSQDGRRAGNLIGRIAA
jgi:putative transposase